MLQFFQKLRRSYTESTRGRRSEPTEPEHRSLISHVLWNWPEDEPIRVNLALERYPQLMNSQQALIDLAIEEYNDRCDAGEELTAVRFADQFPDIRSRLLDSLIFEHALGQMTGFFQNALYSPVRDEDWPGVGETVGGFHLVKPLGRGGFSRVFVAEDLEYSRRQVAVKICHSDSHEAIAMKDLQHSSIGTIHYVRSIPERSMVAICMPLVTRATLQQVERAAWKPVRRPRSAAVAWDVVQRKNELTAPTPAWAGQSFVDWSIELAIKLCRGLQVSHDQNIIHCDLKPTNILITPEGSPLLVDFNVAFQQTGRDRPANVGGTLPYMAPEQIRAFAGKGFSEVTAKTDLFGLGATLYELLTGRLPFPVAETSEDGLRRLLECRRTAPEPIRNSNRDVSVELDELILSCMAYDPKQRPDNAEAVARRLEGLRDSTRVRKVTRTHRAFSGVAIAAVLLLAVVLGTSGDANPERTDGAVVRGAAAIDLSLPANELNRLEDNEVEQVVSAGYDAYATGNYEEAERLFQRALNLAPGHAGALLGRVRSAVYAGNANDVFQMVVAEDHEGIGEKAALSGLCFAATHRHPEAIRAFEAAIRLGAETPEVLTCLAYSEYMSGQRDAGFERLSKLVDEADGQAPARAKLLLARMLFDRGMSEFAQNRATAVEFPHAVQILDLVEQCPDSRERGFVASSFYPMIGRSLQNLPGGQWQVWSERAVAEFERGVQAGLPVAYWHGFAGMLTPEAQATRQAQAWAQTPHERHSDHLYYHLCDPLAGTRFDRWIQRSLVASAQVEPNKSTEGIAVAGRLGQ